ncbi:efflux transporter outer membrane subunit [Noviherbaspirillum denitrificans]|uniref:Fusaric acid resistance protein n=1 Tax=Noviherbaspirillum denitrificans TaxID=1968433 RepID=A0A254TD64_9BURK|nr:efflux transporter outer membrane subunit [Noviherbaspirillum denitrificans]OWW20554.1 fusaric acid resistance protein [Noviherbaspirillum denitrificans]
MTPLHFTRRATLMAMPAAAAIALAGCASFDGTIPAQSTLHDANRLAASEALDRHAVSPANWPSARWWQRYGDPQLDQLVTEALADHPSLAIAEARVRQAAAQGGIADAARSPQIAASARNIRQRYSEHGTVPRPLAGSWNVFNEATLNFSHEFDFWGRNQAAVDAALGQLRANEVESQSARLVLASGVVQTYFRLAQAYRQLDLAMQVLKQREELLRLTRQRVEVGIDSDIDLKQAESAIPSARQQIAAGQEAIALIRNQLAAMLGKGPDRGLALERPALALERAAGVPSTVPAELIGRRPDLVAQRWRVEAASRNIAEARARFYPNVSLVAFAGLQSIGLGEFLHAGSRIAGAGPAVSLPVFDGGRLRGNLGARHAEYDLAVEQYNQTLVDALQDVVNQLTSMQWLEEQRGQQAEAVRVAEGAHVLAMQRFRAGLGTYLQVLIAESQVHSQKKLLIDLDARAMQLDAHLIRALGGGALDA